MLGRLVIVALLAGCAGKTPLPPPPPEGLGEVPLQFAQSPTASTRRTQVTVVVFDAAADAPDDAARARVEANFVAYRLRQTLEASGAWGAVRVLPGPDDSAELQIRGEILRSTGAVLQVRVTATDATGRRWLQRDYLDTANADDYLATARDPFEDLYHAVSNDLLDHRRSLGDSTLRRVREISRLRYARSIVPDAYDDYLARGEEGEWVVRRLPADNDTLMARVDRVRESEALFADTVDDHYGALFRSVRGPYTLWRRYDFEQSAALGEYIERSRAKPDKAPGTLEGMERSYEQFRESKYWQETLAELAQSFEQAVRPTAIETEGELIQLEGTLQSQFLEWRALMRAIFAAETGLLDGT